MPRARLKRNCARPRLRRAVGYINERVISANEGCSSRDADNRTRERVRLRERLLRPEGGTRIEIRLPPRRPISRGAVDAKSRVYERGRTTASSSKSPPERAR